LIAQLTPYDQLGVDMFQSVAEWLVDELLPMAGERALDVGCGRGAALARVARAVGPHGHAIGIDMSPRMVELAKADLEAAGVMLKSSSAMQWRPSLIVRISI
jgi:ubiquinone/menaquinone biosynthesis C-methylase UbiE